MRLLHRSILLSTLALLPPGGATAAEVTILSGPEDPLIHGVRGNDSSYRCSLSADGQQVAFESFAHQLVPDDFNGSRDVFVRDRSVGPTRRVSVGEDGMEVEAEADYPAISGDGRYVAFTVDGALLGGATAYRQAYLFDRLSGDLVLLSRSTSGGYGNGSASSVAISSLGTHVVFSSTASDLVAGDANSAGDAFVYDIAAGTIALASTNAAGVQGDQNVYRVDISFNGNRVAFETASSTLDALDTNGQRDVYVKFMGSGVLRLLSTDAAGAVGSSGSNLEDLADDGRSVLFNTGNALVAADGNGLSDVYLRRLAAAAPVRVSDTLAGADGDDDATTARSNEDGTRVVFTSAASNLDAGADGTIKRLFLRDLTAGTLSLLPTGGEQSAVLHALDAAGTVVCFASSGTDLVADDLNGVNDVYLLDIATGEVELASRAATAEPVYTGNGDSFASAISNDGRRVLFESTAEDLDLEQDDISPYRKLYLLDQDTGRIDRVATVPGGVDADRLNPEMSSDGRYIVFESYATNLAPDDDGTMDVFRFDIEAGAMERISEAQAGGPGHGSRPSVSDDGTRVAFVSDAADGPLLDPTDLNVADDVYLWDDGVQRRISVAPDGSDADDDSRDPRLSADGKWLVFESQADNLTLESPIGRENLYLADLDGGSLRCLTCGFELSIDPADISDDGTRVLFNVYTDGPSPPPFENHGLYLYDRLADAVYDLAVPFDWNHAYNVDARLSGDGTTVAFAAGTGASGPSAGAKVVPFEENERLYRYRIDTGELTVELTGDSGEAEGTVHEVAIDGDGSQLLASANAALLPEIDRNGRYDLYQVRRNAGVIALPATVVAAEGDGSVVLRLERSGGSDGIVRAGIDGVEGSALQGEDFLVPADTVEWLDGESGVREITVTLVDDALPEIDETFGITLYDIVGGASHAGITTTVTITDADTPLADPVFSDGFEAN